jgi:hypothetical protein
MPFHIIFIGLYFRILIMVSNVNSYSLKHRSCLGGFCEDALPTNVIQLSIIDQQGYIWQCDMVFIMADNTIF